MLLINELEVKAITKLLHEASKILLDLQNSELTIYKKDDGSKVTNADLEINNFIVSYLQKNHPQLPVISEEQYKLETSDNPNLEQGYIAKQKQLVKKLIKSKEAFFCLDPLDGTSAFIKGIDEYVISLGALEGEDCSYGWIAIPSMDCVYYRLQNKIFRYANNEHSPVTCSQPEEAYIMPKATRSRVTVLHDEKFLFQSSALKFVSLIEGQGKYLIQTHRTKLWDVVAGFALLECLGLEAISSQNHKPIVLNSLNIPPFYVNNV